MARRPISARLMWDMNTKILHPFRVSGIPADVIEKFRNLSDDELQKNSVIRQVVDAKPGFPCRVTLQDAEIGERVFLFSFEHLGGRSPEVLRVPTRPLSMRAYDVNDLLVNAEVIESAEVEPSIQRLLDDARVAYVHVHNARPGCFSCRIDRA